MTSNFLLFAQIPLSILISLLLFSCSPKLQRAVDSTSDVERAMDPSPEPTPAPVSTPAPAPAPAPTPVLVESAESVTTAPATREVSEVRYLSSTVGIAKAQAGQRQILSVTLGTNVDHLNAIGDIRIIDVSRNQIITKDFGLNLLRANATTLHFAFDILSSYPAAVYGIEVGIWSAGYGSTLMYSTVNQFYIVNPNAPALPGPIVAPIATSSFNMTCQENVRQTSGKYQLENNTWGNRGIAPGSYSQCVGLGPATSNTVSARINWKWPEGPNEVKGYPEIIYGQKPGSVTTPGSNLPKRLNDIVSAKTSFASRSSVIGKGQLTYDLWLTSDPTPNNYFDNVPKTHEIMITMDPWGGYGLGRNPSWFQEETTIDNIRYRVYRADNFGSGWRFLVFHVVTPMARADLNLQPLFTYLKQKGLVSGTEYLSSIEFGVEMEQGEGEVFIDMFSADVR